MYFSARMLSAILDFLCQNITCRSIGQLHILFLLCGTNVTNKMNSRSRALYCSRNRKFNTATFASILSCACPTLVNPQHSSEKPRIPQSCYRTSATAANRPTSSRSAWFAMRLIAMTASAKTTSAVTMSSTRCQFSSRGHLWLRWPGRVGMCSFMWTHQVLKSPDVRSSSI